MDKDHVELIVSDNQFAFIPRSVILDNILLSQELVRGYHRNTGVPRSAMRIDIMKFYNTIN